MYKIRLTVSGVGAAISLREMLSAWGYSCEVLTDGTVERLVARGEQQLSTECFRDLVNRVVALGGAIYGFRMGMDGEAEDRPSQRRARIATVSRKL